MRRSIAVAIVTALAGLSGCTAAPPRAQPEAVHATAIEVPQVRHPDGETPDWWFLAGAAAAHANAGGPKRAKNVIVFLGDGMSIPTIAAARILEGQRNGASGEENRLHFERFPATALSRTYETDRQTPDSAGTMSAIMTGIKTRYGVISVDQRATRGDCASSRGTEAVTALELAAAAGMATGFVTTARVTHATPAATYGHLPERNWEADADLPKAARESGCVDFSRQLVEFDIGGGINVALGGGRSTFLPRGTRDPEYPEAKAERRDGRDLTAEWQRKPGAAYVWNAEQLAAVAPDTRHLLGLFEPSHMRFAHERAADPAGEPSLAEMTRAALKLLARNDNGYFLMVEGARIDHAHHAGNAFRALEETIELSRAVAVADEMTSPDDTLILVTADHAHTMAFMGYPERGNPILGKVAAGGEQARDAVGLPYTTLVYANGPGYVGASNRQPEGSKHYPHYPKTYEQAAHGRPDLSAIDTTAPDYMQEAIVPFSSETHGGDDVAVFARGPGSDAVRGSLEQNALFHVIVQNVETLRAELCRLDACDEAGVPIRRVPHERLRAAAAR